jgi:threonine aldolase
MDFIQKLKENNILLIGMGEGKLRFVTHLDYTGTMHKELLKKIATIF